MGIRLPCQSHSTFGYLPRRARNLGVISVQASIRTYPKIEKVQSYAMNVTELAAREN